MVVDINILDLAKLMIIDGGSVYFQYQGSIVVLVAVEVFFQSL